MTPKYFVAAQRETGWRNSKRKVQYAVKYFCEDIKPIRRYSL